MPFVVRKVEPRLLCRGHVPPGILPVGGEMESIAHGALTGCLKQLASVLTLAEDIFAELTNELTRIADRSGILRQKVDKVEDHLGTIDPKKIPVPESDISTFASRKVHFHAKSGISTMLFTAESRPRILRELYEVAAVIAVRSLDSIDGDGRTNSTEMYLCTPVLGKRRPDYSLDIEARVPAAIEDLRRWTSTEALGDVTVPPDCMSRILADTTDDDAVDHKLPSPEEQLQAVALKFPAEVVAVDVSGRGFERMSIRRRSLLSSAVADPEDAGVKRRSRPRRPRGKRRNTIAGIDQKEIREAIGGETTVENREDDPSPSTSRAQRSVSTDILGSKKDSPSEKKSHFNTLKAWGISRLKLISPKSSQNVQDVAPGQNEATDDDKTGAGATDDTNIYESVMLRRRKEKYHERKPSSSSSSGKSTSSIPVSMPVTERQANVKLRESAAQRRERRKGNREDGLHSSSGNWSASSESGRASVGSENTTTTHPPRSTTTASIGTSSTSLSHVRRPKGRDTSASSSVTSEDTLTPDIIHDISAVPFSDDGENSSVYSCDTEGYYTSFHVDSGLKTLREEESLPQSPLVKSCDLSPDLASPIAENEYELFGRGSTSTTTSSAGTVCTALLAPPPPERKSSLTVVAMVHGQNGNGGQSPDSGHNTSSSPVESASSPACTGRSCSEFEYSESSDLEGCERVERIRSKTAINASRIPSMCVITPPGSDDETSKDFENFSSRREMLRKEFQSPGSVLMSATVGTSKMEVINGQDKNPYATVQTVPLGPASEKAKEPHSRRNGTQNSGQNSQPFKVGPLSSVLGKLRGVLPGTKKTSLAKDPDQETKNVDSGDYVTIADVRNNNDKRSDHTGATGGPAEGITYTNSDLFRKDVEYVSLSELPKKQDSSLERRRQGARVTLDSEGKVVYSSDSLKRRKGAHTTFNPGPFVKEGISPATSPLLRRAQTTVRAVTRDLQRDGLDTTDCPLISTPPTSPQLGKLIIRAPKSPERAASPSYVRTPSTIVGPTSPTSSQKHFRGAYVNVQGDEDSHALLNVPIDSVLPECPNKLPPPPYIEPPALSKRKENDSCKISSSNLSKKQQTCDRNSRHSSENESQRDDTKRRNYEPGRFKENNQQRPTWTNSPDTRQHASRESFERNAKLFLQRQRQNSGVARGQKTLRRDNYDTQTRGEQFSSNRSSHGENRQQFYTLPAQRPQRDTAESPRSVTPDIMRGLGRGPLSTMHAMARHGQNGQVGFDRYRNTNRFGSDGHLDASEDNAGKYDNQGEIDQQTENRTALDLRNRFKVPTSLAAIGYRFIASSSMHDLQDTKTPTRDSLRHTMLSPIDPPTSTKGFQSSTPGCKSSRQTIDKSIIRGVSPLGQTTSGRNTPTNVILSPTKSTMSNEELFAAIHKSKKRLNIKEEAENLSPTEAITSLAPNQDVTGYGRSSESHSAASASPAANPRTATSRLNFKRLLLQQSVKTGPTRLSAAEQLKLSRQQNHHQHQQQQHALAHHQPSGHQIAQPTPAVKVLSPRATWRFQSPRSDVLSSTIIEDSAAEEKAMKPSPEYPSPISRTKPSNLCTDLRDGNSNTYATNAATLPQTMGYGHSASNPRRLFGDISVTRTPEMEDRSNRNDTPEPRMTHSSQVNTSHRQTPILSNTLQSEDPFSTMEHKRAMLSAAETRRINNQLARAQFLAGSPTLSPNSRAIVDNSYLWRHSRARSESPQHGVPENVSRSPSAPALETAL